MDYEKVCWYCGKETVHPSPELGLHWFRCSGCDTTFIKPSATGSVALSVEHDDAKGGTKYKSHPIRRRNRSTVR